MTHKKLNIGFDRDDKINVLQQSVCSMLSGASKAEERATHLYQSIYGQMDMANIDGKIKGQISDMVVERQRDYNKLFDIAKAVGCEIYESNGEEKLVIPGRKLGR